MSRAVKSMAGLTAELPPSCRIVGMLIAAHTNRAGEARPGVRTLAKLGGLHVETVCIAVKIMETAGCLAVTRARGCANRYRLAVEVPPVALVDYPQARGSDPRGTEHMSARVEGANRAGLTRAEVVLRTEEKKGHPYPCCCDDCMAAIEARRA